MKNASQTNQFASNSLTRDLHQELRDRAEALIQRKAPLPEDPEQLSPEELRRMLHDLQLYQIELELQNEELRQLDERRARYFELFDLAPIGYCAISISGLILEPNLTAAMLLGVGRSQLTRTPITRYIYPADQDIYYLHRKKLFDSGEPQECELRMQTANGMIVWVRMTGVLSRDAAGVPLYRVVLCDSTASKLAEEELRQKEQQFRLIFEERFNQISENSRVYHWEIGSDGLYSYIAPACKKVLGYNAGEIVGKLHFYELHPLAGREAFKQTLQEIMARKERFQNLKKHFITASGRCLLIASDGIPVLDADGNLIGYRGMDTDITLR